MGAPAAGQVVLLPFPFSDLTRNKLRPALLLAAGGKGDWISCQLTSNPYADPLAIELKKTDFAEGGLKPHQLRASRQAVHRARVAVRTDRRQSRALAFEDDPGRCRGPDPLARRLDPQGL